MLALFILFLTAILVGSRSEKPGFGPAIGLMLLMFLGLCLMWQSTHQWPGVLNPAFAAQVARSVVVMFVGLGLGGLIFGGAQKRGSF